MAAATTTCLFLPLPSGERVGVRGSRLRWYVRQKRNPLTLTLSPEGRGDDGTPTHLPDTDRPRPIPC
ncbi:hypothetical protein J2851_005893 [Azospirillum rugosum]|uniref:Uncharacterized protein n=1 Tax=Azospirillum rugosum TaxID=416170 RepID=A0ABS4SVI8_9PROT|nr:hypothetical protein [Azospirillum rugosum]MDQ0530759.1 hypothetical protein [Azospirillum rugosum]